MLRLTVSPLRLIAFLLSLSFPVALLLPFSIFLLPLSLLRLGLCRGVVLLGGGLTSLRFGVGLSFGLSFPFSLPFPLAFSFSFRFRLSFSFSLSLSLPFSLPFSFPFSLAFTC